MIGARYYARSTANAYFSFGITSGFGAHNDDHDVIVLQIEGRKSWRFFGTEAKPNMATVNDLAKPIEDDVSEMIVLNQGDILFIPKSTWHDVVAINEPSLHLTISVVYPTVSEYVFWLLEQHKYEQPYRDIKLNDAELDATVRNGVEFFEKTINMASLATYLDFYYARHRACQVQPSFPSLNRAQTGDLLRKVPFTVTTIENGSCTECLIFALGRKHLLSQCEKNILANLSHDQSMSFENILRLFEANYERDEVSTALEKLLDRGLISKCNDTTAQLALHEHISGFVPASYLSDGIAL